MTLNEFRAWFDGFSEAIGDAPTPDQWAKIKAKVDALDASVAVRVAVGHDGEFRAALDAAEKRVRDGTRHFLS